MSTPVTDLPALTATLHALGGARVQKLFLPRPGRLELECRVPGHTHLLVIDTGIRPPGAGLIAARAATGQPATGAQATWRSLLEDGRLGAALAHPQLPVWVLPVHHRAGTRRLVVSHRAGAIDLSVVDASGKVLVASGPDGRAHQRPGRVHDAQLSDLPLESTPPESTADLGDAAVSQLLRWGRRLDPSTAGAPTGAPSEDPALRLLRERRRKLQRTREAVAGDEQRVIEAEKLGRWATWLAPHAHRFGRGQAEATVTAYTEDGAVEVSIPLLPHLTGKENLARLFHQHRRLEAARERVWARAAELQSRLDLVDELLRGWDSLAADPMLRAERVRACLGDTREDSRRTASRGPAPRRPYRTFVSASGKPIWVGRSARDNDALTFGHARGQDVWMHARGLTGSHVIVPGGGRQGPDPQTLLDAATLAAHFSAARGELLTEVAHTRRFRVRKPKDAAPGGVVYTGETILSVRLEPDRLARLLQAEQQADTTTRPSAPPSSP